MKDLINIVKSLEDSSLLPEGVSEKTQNEAKEQKGGFLSMLLGTLGPILLGNILTGKGAIAKRVSEETKSKRRGREQIEPEKDMVKKLYVLVLNLIFDQKNIFFFSSSSIGEF